MTLSNREKNMLFVLGLMVIGWGSSQYVITPMMEKHQVLEVEYQQLLDEQMAIQQKLLQEATIDEEIVSYQKSIQDISSYFYDANELEYFYDWIIDTAGKYGVEVLSLSFGEASLVSPEIYAVDEADTTYPLKEYQEKIDNIMMQTGAETAVDRGLQNESNSELQDDIINYNFEVSISGTKHNIQSFIDILSGQDQYTIIQTYAMNESESSEVMANINITFYVVDKIKNLKLK